jgi:hypothetical protein
VCFGSGLIVNVSFLITSCIQDCIYAFTVWACVVREQQIWIIRFIILNSFISLVFTVNLLMQCLLFEEWLIISYGFDN